MFLKFQYKLQKQLLFLCGYGIEINLVTLTLVYRIIVVLGAIAEVV